MGIVKLFCVALFLPLFLPLLQPTFAQQGQSETTACVAADERIYEPGVGGVKPPEIQKDEDWKHTPGADGPFSVELLLNSDGRVCRARLLAAKNRAAAAKSAQYISERWKFKPAIRQGKSVAVTIRINFNIQ
jgi:TonB family protein